MKSTADSVRDFVRLMREKRKLESDLKATVDAIKSINSEVIESLQHDGIDRLHIDGMSVYIKRDVWASSESDSSGLPDHDRANQALRDAGLGDLIQERFNSRTLSAWVREQDLDGRPLPSSFEGAIKISETFKVAGRESS